MTRDRRSEVLTRGLRKVWTKPTASPVAVRRLAAKLTQAELAARAGLSRATVERVEATGEASDATWWAIARALNVAREEIDKTFAARVSPFDRSHCDA